MKVKKDSTLKNRIEFVGVIGILTSVIMVTSILDQIRINLGTGSGSIIFPALYLVNISTWTIYLTLKNGKDRKILWVNAYAFVMQFINLITAGGLI